MNSNTSKRALLALSLALVVVLCLAAWGWARAMTGEVQVAIAAGWTQLLLEERDRAIERTNAVEVATSLARVGSFRRPAQAAGGGIVGHLQKVTERIRENAEKDIIRHLRSITGEDLGDAPQPWIEKYGKVER